MKAPGALPSPGAFCDTSPTDRIYCYWGVFMKKTIPTWQMVGFIFACILGTLLHFLYDWTGGSLIAALFSAVNESIWEHTKLLFYPMVIFALIEYKAWGRDVTDFWGVKLWGIMFGFALIPVLYYTYSGVLGISADWFNISIFFISSAATFFLETKLFQKIHRCFLPQWVSVAIICLLAAIYTVLTFWPPAIPFFQDPVTGTYGYFRTDCS